MLKGEKEGKRFHFITSLDVMSMNWGKDLFIYVSLRVWFYKQMEEGLENPNSKQKRSRHSGAVFSDTVIQWLQLTLGLIPY